MIVNSVWLKHNIKHWKKLSRILRVALYQIISIVAKRLLKASSLDLYINDLKAEMDELSRKGEFLTKRGRLSDYVFVLAFLDAVTKSEVLHLGEERKSEYELAYRIAKKLFEDDYFAIESLLGKFAAMQRDFNKGWEFYQRVNKLEDGKLKGRGQNEPRN